MLKKTCLIVALLCALAAAVWPATAWPQCTAYTAQSAGTLDPLFEEGEFALGEVSGLAASRKSPGVLWMHNDRGDASNLYAINTSGTLLAIYDVKGVPNRDWEDLAIGPGSAAGRDYLYIGDLGNEFYDRTDLGFYRVLEPTVSATQSLVRRDLYGAMHVPVEYPNAAHDSEALLVDPANGDVYIVTRDFGFTSNIYRAPAPHTGGVTIDLELVATLTGLERITGGDISADGRRIVMRDGSRDLMWRREAGTELWEAFAGPRCVSGRQDRPDTEAIGFAADGRTYFTTSEHQTPFNPAAPQVPLFVYHQWLEAFSIVRSGPAPIAPATVGFTVTFSDGVTGVDAADFLPVDADASTTGLVAATSATLTGITGGPEIYRISVAVGDFSGNLRLDLRDDATVVSSATGQGLVRGFHAGEVYAIRSAAQAGHWLLY